MTDNGREGQIRRRTEVKELQQPYFEVVSARAVCLAVWGSLKHIIPVAAVKADLLLEKVEAIARATRKFERLLTRTPFRIFNL